MVSKLYKARTKKTKDLIKKIESIMLEHNLTREWVAHKCKVRENTVYRWLLSLTDNKHSIKTMQPSTMFWAEKFIEEYHKNDGSSSIEECAEG